MNSIVLITKAEKDYELIASGGGKKVERYGKYILVRPDPGAIWSRSGGDEIWKNFDAEFIRKGEKGEWRPARGNDIKKVLPESWEINFGDLIFQIKPTSFKHTGLFPEQEPNWTWMTELIKKSDRPIKVLNLFAYTGGATLACAKAGAEVIHLDASKKAIEWARENAKISGLEEKPVRWILDDASIFLKREIKRGNKYDAIIMDPPSFGHGPSGQLWKIEEDFLKLMELCRDVLSPAPLFFLINGYASGYSPIAYGNNLEFLTQKFGGQVEAGELVIEESNSKRLMPAGIFARWKS